MTVDLAALGWGADLAAAYAAHDHRGQVAGRVVRVDRGVCTVATAAGTVRASLGGEPLAAGARDAAALPCAGDWVVVRTWPDGRATVEAVLPRRTALIRASADRRSEGQVLAANLDAVAVVEPVEPAPDPVRIERLLALAFASGAAPLVVLSKADATRHIAGVVAEVAELAPGVPVHPVSATRGTGLDALRPYVAAGRTLGLVGASGAGKSSLVNALAGAAVMATRQLRRDDKGRHTTTYRALVPLAGGGAVLDTPGLRAVGLYGGPKGLAATFADVTALAARCRYADCSHEVEPGCAVRAALDDGLLPVRRYETWRALNREVAAEAARRDVRLTSQLRAEARRRTRDRRATHRP